MVVTNPDGQSGLLPNGVVSLAPIKIKSIEPASGRLEGGTKITIIGEPTVEAQRRTFASRFVEGVVVRIGEKEANKIAIKKHWPPRNWYISEHPE